MTLTRVALALVGLLAACGGSDPKTDPLAGEWHLDLNTVCVRGLVFKDVRYQAGISCLLATGVVGVQMESGTYEATGDGISFYPTQTSCPGAGAHTWVASAVYDLPDKSTLRISTASSTLSFGRVPDSAGASTGTFEYGCHNLTAMTFTTHPIEQL